MTRYVLLARVSVDGTLMTTWFDGAGVFEAVSAMTERTATAFSNTAGEMGCAYQGVVQSKAVTLRCCAAVLWTDKRVWDPISESCVLAASSDITLAMARAVSLLGGFGAGTKLGSEGIPGSLAGVILAIRRIDPNCTYCLAYVFLITALNFAPLGIGVRRSRTTMTVVMMMLMSGSGHEKVD